MGAGGDQQPVAGDLVATARYHDPVRGIDAAHPRLPHVDHEYFEGMAQGSVKQGDHKGRKTLVGLPNRRSPILLAPCPVGADMSWFLQNV